MNEQPTGDQEPPAGPRPNTSSDISVATRAGKAAYDYCEKAAKAAAPTLCRVWAFCTAPWRRFWALPAGEKFTFGILVATGVYAWITSRQLDVMRDQITLARRSAIDQARATQDSFDLARRSHEASARAWLVLDPTSVRVSPCPPRVGSVVTFHLFNAGNSPAKHIQHRVQIQLANGPLPEPIRFSGIASEAGSKPVIGPKLSFESDVTLENRPDGLDVTRGIPAGFDMYLVGQVYYRDGFDDLRMTKFCLRYQASDLPGRYNFVFCAHSNEIE